MSSSETVARYRYHAIFGLERVDSGERVFDVEIVLRMADGRIQRAVVTLPDGDIQDVNGPWSRPEDGLIDARRWAELKLRSVGR